MRHWLIGIREAKGFSQAYVSRAIGVKQPTYWEYEHGDTTPSPKIARRIGTLLGFDWTLFFPDDDEKERKRA